MWHLPFYLGILRETGHANRHQAKYEGKFHSWAWKTKEEKKKTKIDNWSLKIDYKHASPSLSFSLFFLLSSPLSFLLEISPRVPPLRVSLSFLCLCVIWAMSPLLFAQNKKGPWSLLLGLSAPLQGALLKKKNSQKSIPWKKIRFNQSKGKKKSRIRRNYKHKNAAHTPHDRWKPESAKVHKNKRKVTCE